MRSTLIRLTFAALAVFSFAHAATAEWVSNWP